MEEYSDDRTDGYASHAQSGQRSKVRTASREVTTPTWEMDDYSPTGMGKHEVAVHAEADESGSERNLTTPLPQENGQVKVQTKWTVTHMGRGSER